MLYSEAATGRVYGLNSSGWSASGLTPEFLAGKGLTEMPQKGIFTVTVPGTVAGWEALHEKFGTLPLARLLEPAIRTAEEGFPLMDWGRHSPDAMHVMTTPQRVQSGASDPRHDGAAIPQVLPD